MREIVVISGKGGTGKTTICAALAALASREGHNPVLCDLDVDVPDLHIIFDPRVQQEHPFVSGNTAVINEDVCTQCGRCLELCQFGAVGQNGNGQFTIDALDCEGCGVCHKLCPTGAIEFPQRHCGTWYLSQTRFGSFVHAQLDPGQENSGRLVSLLKQQARQLAPTAEDSLILCDGSPGIGCPVISSLSGATLAVAVVEPTPSGRHDFERVADLCRHFRIPVSVIINKADLNNDEARAIEEYAAQQGYTLAGRLPFSPLVTEAMIRGEALTERDSPLTSELEKIWGRICAAADKPARRANINSL